MALEMITKHPTLNEIEEQTAHFVGEKNQKHNNGNSVNFNRKLMAYIILIEQQSFPCCNLFNSKAAVSNTSKPMHTQSTQ